MKKNVLLIDDEEDVHVLIENLLDLKKYNVISATDGSEGFQTAYTMTPDLIILDVQMPKLDGFEVYKKLLEDHRTSNIPVIMLTGIAEKRGIHFDNEDMKQYFTKEPAAYIEKPFEPKKFVDLVDSILN